MIWEQMMVSQKESFIVQTVVIKTTASIKESFNIFTLGSCYKVPKLEKYSCYFNISYREILVI